MEMQTQRSVAVETAVATVFRRSSLPDQATFHKDGEYWTIARAGSTVRIKDSKGLAYLAHLLRHPLAEFHVLNLAGGIASQSEEEGTTQSAQRLPRGDGDLEKAGIHISSLGDAGEMLDEQAKVAYRRRLCELREELAEAKELGQVERAEQAEAEIDALTGELSRAVGLGGRSRRAASASERARQSVTKSLKTVVEKIAQTDAALGGILRRSVRTGTFCSYRPPPEFPIAWEFGATSIEPAEQPTSSCEPAPAPTAHLQSSPATLELSRFSLTERTAFVNRDSERGTIRAAIDRALAGRGSVVILAGGPGVGKTRLALETAEDASRLGFECLLGHCYERDEPFPFLPFAEIIESSLAQAPSQDNFRLQMGDNAAELAQIAPSLRRIFPDIPQPLDLPAQQKRRHLFQSLLELFARAQVQPRLFILDDLHWADESTLELLIHLASRISQVPLVIIGTYRDEYSGENPPLVRTLEELIRLGIRPLKLGGLSKDAVAQMLHGLSQRQAPESLVSLIFEESQGNPFFVEEVYRHLVEEGKVFDEAGQFFADIELDESDVPENVRLIISRRLERFAENEKRALAAAAVIGRSFSFQLLTAVSQIDDDELFAIIEKAQQMGMIVASAEGAEKPFNFRHELVRQTLLATISAPRQQRMHARVAEAIEQLNRDAVNERAGEITDHLLKAGWFVDRQKLVRWLTLAGKSALDAGSFEQARRNFRSALSHRADISAKETAELLAALGMAEVGLELWDTALPNFRESLEIYIGLGDRDMIGRSFSELTDALILAGGFHQAIETACRGLAHIEGDVSVDRVRLLDRLSQALAFVEGYRPAHEALKEAPEPASQAIDRTNSIARSNASVSTFVWMSASEAIPTGAGAPPK